VRSTNPITVLEAPWNDTPGDMYQYPGEAQSDVLIRAMSADVGACEKGEAADLLDIPGFPDSEPNPRVLEELARKGWGELFKQGAFGLFQGVSTVLCYIDCLASVEILRIGRPSNSRISKVMPGRCPGSPLTSTVSMPPLLGHFTSKFELSFRRLQYLNVQVGTGQHSSKSKQF
jgi:hypothetical protein